MEQLFDHCAAFVGNIKRQMAAAQVLSTVEATTKPYTFLFQAIRKYRVMSVVMTSICNVIYKNIYYEDK